MIMNESMQILPQFVLRVLRSVLYPLKSDFPLLRNLSFESEKDTDSFRAILYHCEYLQRSHPSDGRITMVIGCTRLLLNIPTASEALELLNTRAPSRVCATLLLCVRAHFQNWSLAKDELAGYLSQYVPLPHPVFSSLAKTITCHKQYEGWVSLSLTGKLVLTDYSSLSTKNVSLIIDKETFSLASLVYVREGPEIRITLPENWKTARSITLESPDRKYIGTVFNIDNFLKIDGFVEATETYLKGWARYRSEPERPVKLHITAQSPQKHTSDRSALYRSIKITTCPTKLFDIRNLSGEACLPPFSHPLNNISFSEKSLSVTTETGVQLYGSPLHYNILAEQAVLYAHASREAFPALYKKRVNPSQSGIRKVVVIIPVYNGFETTRLCLKQVLRHNPDNARVIVINDASPNEDIVHFLNSLPENEYFSILHNDRNLGFPASVNKGMRQREAGEDVILLNSDTIVSENWIFQLQKAVYSKENIGTATPLSNNATIFSYPDKDGKNPFPTIEECEELNRIMMQSWQGELPEVPTAHGFCMYIKSECLESVGLFREDIFAQGYGEENDFSRRATALGWRHVACLGTYVGHAESQSFSHVKTDLMGRNLGIMNDVHKGYGQIVRNWQLNDPLLFYRRRLDQARFRKHYGFQKSVFLIAHDREGGILRHIGHRSIDYVKYGYISFTLKPDRLENGKKIWRLDSVLQQHFPNLIIPQSLSAFRHLAEHLNCQKIEIHSYIGNGLENTLHLSQIGLPYDVYIHDYSWFCPQITLTQDTGTYCGEPSETVCQSCLKERGSKTGEYSAIPVLRQKSAAILEHAEQVIAPSQDTAQRLRRYFSAPINVIPWEILPDLREITFPVLPASQKRIIGILGAISTEKGFYQILALARFIAQNAFPIEFVLIGYSCNDNALLDTGIVKITGKYKEFEIKHFIETFRIDWFFLPSIWPETWSYVLTQLWMVEKPVIVYDIGAPAERIRQSGGGLIVPLHMPYSRLVWILHNPVKFQPVRPNNHSSR